MVFLSLPLLLSRDSEEKQHNEQSFVIHSFHVLSHPSTVFTPLLCFPSDPVVDTEKCVGCETCVQVCPESLFEMKDGVARFKQERVDDCTACETCVNNCPVTALSMVPKV